MRLEFKQLKANLKKDFSGLAKVNFAVLGDSSTQLLCQAIRGAGYTRGLDLRIYEADFDQIDREVLTSTSALYESDPDCVLVFHSAQKLLNNFYALPPSLRHDFANDYLKNTKRLWESLTLARPRRIIHCNLAQIQDGVFGHFANKTSESFLYQTRKINFELMNLAEELGHVYILDVCVLSAQAGDTTAFSPQLYVNAAMAFGLDFLPQMAQGAVEILSASLGSARKCLVLDLDNTIWGGVIGDDGVQNIEIGELGVGKAFTELQLWARELKRRGIILAVCSKNDDKVAREPFLNHPDMVLRLEDIAVFVANWQNKPDNLLDIQKRLNIGAESMVFLDDSPFEREMVRQAFAGMTVPELPMDPAEYVPFLRAQNLFETASVSQEDVGRTLMYQQAEERVSQRSNCASESDFLARLQMTARVSPFTVFNTPRVAQLTQRSNQFNLRTIRFTEDEIGRIARDPLYLTFAVHLEDRFGDYGLISAVILKRQEQTFRIDTWIMSCRVINRGVERAVLDRLVHAAAAAGAVSLVGEYLPTAKNALVKDLYRDLGFLLVGGEWSLSLDKYVKTETFITEAPDDLPASSY